VAAPHLGWSMPSRVAKKGASLSVGLPGSTLATLKKLVSGKPTLR